MMFFMNDEVPKATLQGAGYHRGVVTRQLLPRDLVPSENEYWIRASKEAADNNDKYKFVSAGFNHKSAYRSNKFCDNVEWYKTLPYSELQRTSDPVAVLSGCPLQTSYCHDLFALNLHPYI